MAQKNAEQKKNICYRIKVRGIVQGVGFRPFVFKLAQEYGLKGTVSNSSLGVVIEVEGEEESLEDFILGLKTLSPPLSVIDAVEKEILLLKGFQEFTIMASQKETGDGKGKNQILIPPDVATCKECQEDLLNPLSPYNLYPFTNCTNCGPRFTIIQGLPYDRGETSMVSFAMCNNCYKEYNDSRNRRFHAQPTACPGCGPRVSLVDNEGGQVKGNWLEKFWELMLKGKIVAVKSLGGFHLVCDAHNEEAINTLRKRKKRIFKPLALMMKDVAVVRKYCRINSQEEKLLLSPRGPIVILQNKGKDLTGEIAPNLNTLGVMVPYTPLHFLLFRGPLEVMVMTSGNLGGLPITTDNSEALGGLASIADYFLWHDRDIVNGCDDSLLTLVEGEPQMFRRSRGYVPGIITVPGVEKEELNSCAPGVSKELILALGGEMKNTFCLLQGNQAVLSQHMGEVNTLEAEENLKKTLNYFFNIYKSKPKVVASDMHPGYSTSLLAGSMEAEEKILVQHHHAHMASCMAENGLQGEVIGVILDGTGYGLDGNIWGFEILKGGYLDFTREYHLSYIPLPGGERAVEEPWRMAVSYLYHSMGEKGKALARDLFGFYGKELELVLTLLEKEFNSPLASSCGRLFDGVSALLGICHKNTYEGQGAQELGELVSLKNYNTGDKIHPYPFKVEERIINLFSTWRCLGEDVMRGEKKVYLARRFHDTLVESLKVGVEKVGSRRGLRQVVFSGGSWHNTYLLVRLRRLLEERGYQVYYHQKVPPNDGGLSLGQAVIAQWRWSKNVCGSSWQGSDC